LQRTRQQTCGAKAVVDSQDLPHLIRLIIGTATGMAWGLTQSGFSRPSPPP
jgi:hypothetical protein